MRPTKHRPLPSCQFQKFSDDLSTEVRASATGTATAPLHYRNPTTAEMFLQVTIGCLALLAVGSTALEEHPHFCIDTEPLLLSEIDRHVVIPTEKDLQCHIKATTLTVKEKVGTFNAPWFLRALLFHLEPTSELPTQ